MTRICLLRLRCHPPTARGRPWQLVAGWLGILVAGSSLGAPATFEAAKDDLRAIYADQNRNGQGDTYCGCDWDWTTPTGGRMDLQGCGYAVRAQPGRAARLEWEHVVPAENFGRARRCWRNGGRAACQQTDPVFNVMEADLHNIVPSVGEINGDRSNFRYQMLPTTRRRHGACEFKVDFGRRFAEPRDAVKGMLARIYFYMHDRYDLRMSDAQQKLLMAWDARFPVTAWEVELNRRTATRMGHDNPFVTGAMSWTLGHRNSGTGLSDAPPGGAHPMPAPTPVANPTGVAGDLIRGNKRSGVYHLARGCPGYTAMSPGNIVTFNSEADAQAAGYRKAGNCR